MEKLKYFLECYLHLNEDIDNVNNLIQSFKKEFYDVQLGFIRELHQIINTKNYLLASRIIEKYGHKILNIKQTEEIILFIYNKLLDKHAILNLKNFEKDCKVIFCPVCCPDPEKTMTFNLIDKATIIDNNMKIYICKPCKLVWTTQKIKKDNAQDYKKFMRTFGLKGLWKELKDVDTL